MSTFNKPRIISCSEENETFIGIPRGCEQRLLNVIIESKKHFQVEDRTFGGRKINVQFNGQLREEQSIALSNLLEHENGILCGTTAFGKTITAIKLIAEKKLNTLILVDKINLLHQWEKKISEFLIFDNFNLPDIQIDKKRNKCQIGQIGGGKNTISGIIDIAVMQSLNRLGEVKDLVKDYGLVIVDECHHVSAFSFEAILKTVRAKFVYGLTATPTRKDGHHPIIYMQCGPIRFRDDAKKQAEKRPFNHFVIPRFTSYRITLEMEKKDISIQDLYSEISINDARNQLIIDDVINCFNSSRNCIVLTERKAHIESLRKELVKHIPDLIVLTGGMGIKETRNALEKVKNIPGEKPLVLLSTGKFIGEGFDEPRLDTLFLAMPISWKGTLQQYAGRLHRLFETKKEVIIYDYVDAHVTMFEKMYNKRLNGYSSIGYKVKPESFQNSSADIIFNRDSFLQVFSHDILNSQGNILIVSPFMTKNRTNQILKEFEPALRNGIKITIVTRPTAAYKDSDKHKIEDVLKNIKGKGIEITFKPKIHQKYAIIDSRIVWYGSINLLSYGSAEESIMRIESTSIAFELSKLVVFD